MIVLDHVTKILRDEYGNHIRILDDISCEFGNSDVNVILGPSGSGKTTLLRCINGLVWPDSGHVYIEGKALTMRNRAQMCQKVGMVFQQFCLFKNMTVMENLVYAPMQLLGMSREAAEESAMSMLTGLMLDTKVNVGVSELSGGQKQKIAICRALMMRPKMVLFDEPTSALDPDSKREVITIMKNIKNGLSTGIVVVTHDVDFARAIANNIIFMDHGVILENKSADNFFENPHSNRAKLFLYGRV